MSQQIIDLALINQLLDLPLTNKLENTLFHINQLIIFKNRHQQCNTIITSLKNQINNIRIHIQKEVTKYIDNKISLATKQTNSLIQSLHSKSTLVLKPSQPMIVPSNLQQFTVKQFQVKLNKIKAQSSRLAKKTCFNLCIKPLTFRYQQSMQDQFTHKQQDRNIQKQQT